ncbi:hypothetical protein EDC01DRAFT_665699 [Geopyxis carbonaria]|nr:hypothetical protein EDC01DRAFT_665699 [Geopyxis carbonaria]
MTTAALPPYVLPGQPLATSPPTLAGPGTHLTGTTLSATLAGTPILSTSSAPPTSSSTNPPTTSTTTAAPTTSTAPTLTVSSATPPPILPSIGSTVLARVTRINPRTATISILVVDGTPCVDAFQGVIRQMDVRATEKDKVRIYDSFRPGDVVRALVISLGDQREYYCATAGNRLGVVMAWGENGEELLPVSWREMASRDGGVVERRKVAKPV